MRTMLIFGSVFLGLGLSACGDKEDDTAVEEAEAEEEGEDTDTAVEEETEEE